MIDTVYISLVYNIPVTHWSLLITDANTTHHISDPNTTLNDPHNPFQQSQPITNNYLIQQFISTINCRQRLSASDDQIMPPTTPPTPQPFDQFLRFLITGNSGTGKSNIHTSDWKHFYCRRSYSILWYWFQCWSPNSRQYQSKISNIPHRATTWWSVSIWKVLWLGLWFSSCLWCHWSGFVWWYWNKMDPKGQIREEQMETSCTCWYAIICNWSIHHILAIFFILFTKSTILLHSKNQHISIGHSPFHNFSLTSMWHFHFVII